ncbi:MAG TPA: crossover junction endodeoxyribonuclease RuvC [Nitrospirae bacterium]|nr:crossover junction endodeoxyribonuclease RuvC [bacterium BMS3Abin10]GBE38357.1 crossover junction endodeoxyribonuclease RuvC [bacterium BMS3Bbin08]HDK41249.1 crossover junction endodeoxyribonuclease RuvC [Nitrospirota bacterium]HDK81251.1 crossover junction endodeoxyribonuclease RuvC [Nitrospirota bacterium]
MNMRVIGIDPGTIICGYGIVEVRNNSPVFITAGDIKMNGKDSLPERLKVLYSSLIDVIDKFKPSHLSIEKIFYHKSIRAALALGSTRGVAMLLAAQHAMPVTEYNPTQVKMAITGYGRAEKQQVKEMVIRILGLNSSALKLSEDSSDALALCICHINMGPRLSPVERPGSRLQKRK